MSLLTSVSKIFGDSNEKELKRLRPVVEQINALEPEYERLSDSELRDKTDEFRAAAADGFSLDDLMPEVFATVREAAKRVLGQRHFDVQLIGGAILHQGKIAEMRTGEGKTLVATLAAYLNALKGEGVHVVTVNDYLAKRDAQWMGAVYHELGLSVACLQHETAYLYDPSAEADDERIEKLRPIQRREAYEADVTYGTNSEFGFDYLRDNMVVEATDRVQRPLNYAVVDEVDNILIDEARTPLIISGRTGSSAEQYSTFARLIPSLREEEDYTIDEKLRGVALTQSGIAKMEQRLNVSNMYDPANYLLTHYVDNALKAHVIYKRDVDYVVKDGELVLVDEFTGRLMFGRRLSDGLHQAIEAKEGVEVRAETVTLASITIQNYFRLYEKLAGMTGTAVTEAEEFHKIYGLEVMVVPTHMPMIRTDENDLIYKTQDAKFEAVAQEIEAAQKEGRPVLVGTVSIESSERLSGILTRKGVRHEVLNAKQHEREASIIEQAGKPGAVTVATNMAGRGTDIVLGGSSNGDGDWQAEHDRVVALGGLYIIGTERHEARRIDNQLRGRAGRQGDPGGSRFYISLDDDLMRRFGGDRVRGLMGMMPDDVPFENKVITWSIQNAQTKVEGHNFDIRKRLIDYDDIVNKHREQIYGDRGKIMDGADLKSNLEGLVHIEVETAIDSHLQGEDSEQWDPDGLLTTLTSFFPLPANLTSQAVRQWSRAEVKETVFKYANDLYEQVESVVTPETMRVLERMVMLRTIDTHWVEHLTSMENMRQGIGLQGVAQIDPLVAYKREGIQMFEDLKSRIQNTLARNVYHAAMAQNQAKQQQQAPPMTVVASREQKAMAAAVGNRGAVAVSSKVGRNDPCPCGSGKKYKRCHGI